MLRITDDIERMVRTKPESLPRLSCDGTCWRDVLHLARYRPALLEDYLWASSQQEPDDDKVALELSRMLSKHESWDHPRAARAALKTIERRAPHKLRKEIESSFFRILRDHESKGEQTEEVLTFLIEDFALCTRRDLSSARQEVWSAVDMLGQHLRSRNLLLRGGDGTALERYRQWGAHLMKRLMVGGSDLEAPGLILGKDDQDPTIHFQGVLHRACHDHDKNPDNRLPIWVALDCGADWRKIRDQNLASESAWALIAEHPEVKRARLEDVVQDPGRREPAKRSI